MALKVQARTYDELKIGDHVYAPRGFDPSETLSKDTKGAVKAAADAVGKQEHLYCHHGIVVEVESVEDEDGKKPENVKKVVAFVKEDQVKAQGEWSVGAVLGINKWLIKKADDLFKEHKGTIALEELSAFRHPKDEGAGESTDPFGGTYFVYQYGVSEKERKRTNYLVGSSPALPGGDGHRVAGIAKMFQVAAKRSTVVFGEYSLAEWNCECFASFCTTTRHDVREIEAKLAKVMPHSEKTRSVSKEWLMENGFTQTLQIKALEHNGIFQMRPGARASVFSQENLEHLEDLGEEGALS